MNPLTLEQIDYIKAIPNGNKPTPCRFKLKGKGTVNLITGTISPIGTNIIHQMVYWNFTKEKAQAIVQYLNISGLYVKF